MSNKQPLFRFIASRAPQKLKKEEELVAFIPYPLEDTGHFTSIIREPQRTEEHLDSLKRACEEFNAITDASQLLLSIEGRFIDFAVELANKRQSIYNDSSELEPLLVKYSVGQLDIENYLNIWDNIIYQTVTHKNPSLRDLLIQLLVANHVLGLVENELQHKGAMASIVLPPTFLGLTEKASMPSLKKPLINTEALKNAIKAVDAKKRVNACYAAIEELKKVSKIYDKENQAAYKIAKREHDAAIQEILSSVEAITGEDGKVTRILPETPSFTFEPENPLDEVTLNSRLSSKSYSLLAELDIFSLSSFPEAIDALIEEAKRFNITVFENARLSNRSGLLNGFEFPVPGPTTGDTGTNTFPSPTNPPVLTLPSLGLYDYIIVPVVAPSGHYKFRVSVNVGYLNASINSISYHGKIGSLDISSSVIDNEATNNEIIVFDCFVNGLVPSSTASSIRLHGKLTLSNGVSLSFDNTILMPTTGSGTMALLLSGNEPLGDEPEEPVEDPNASIFIPSGFGIKALGIADYRRVEQDICCYVPGEVSHIENIMAREYKKRGTRRLRRTEDTLTSEKQLEKENQTDTSSTDRYEMQQEVSDVIRQDKSSGTNASLSGDIPHVGSFSTSTNFASNTSQEQSNVQSLNFAKEITEKALQRLVQKTREERVTKIIDEFEETNEHGFDNREGEKHVCGVYRWVDKIYKNQVFNYGKRLMYEFMIPQPATFHMEAVKELSQNLNAIVLEKPIDPRSTEASTNRLRSHKDITPANYHYWAAAYNAEVDSAPASSMVVGKALSFSFNNTGGSNESCSGKEDMVLPEGYYSTRADVYFSASDDWDDVKSLNVSVGNTHFHKTAGRNTCVVHNSTFQVTDKFVSSIPVSYNNFNFWTGNINVNVLLEVLPEYLEQWQIKTFNKIIAAYEQKLSDYNDALTVASQSSRSVNPGIYKQVINTILRKNCISYLVNSSVLGSDFIETRDIQSSLQVKLNSNMDQYAALVKFIEQAFEWEEISYNFYPFYWAGTNQWKNLYKQQVDDPLFTSFLQSGMARVIATVRPGFETAVMHYIATGQIWNGGEVPVIGDELYMSIVEELKNPTYYIAETWETRVPTTLTVIQKGTIALNTEGLPCDCGTDTGIVQNPESVIMEPVIGE